PWALSDAALADPRLHLSADDDALVLGGAALVRRSVDALARGRACAGADHRRLARERSQSSASGPSAGAVNQRGQTPLISIQWSLSALAAALGGGDVLVQPEEIRRIVGPLDRRQARVLLRAVRGAYAVVPFIEPQVVDVHTTARERT